MADVVGRAGFHATHAKDPGQRKPVLDEMMRSLDPERSAFWAKRNGSIVLADEHLNVELVNDGTGELVSCTDPQQVLDYGQSRLDRLHRKITADRTDRNGKKVGGTVTTSMLVAHLPKSMCDEIPDFYPRFHKNGKPMIDPVTGKQMRRSRWVAKDRAQALRFFADVRGYFDEYVVPGGAEACLGASLQFSESTPHGQWLYDTGAVHPDKPDKLRIETSRAYFSHRDVRDDQGRVKSGKVKMREYHAGLKAYLIAKGYDISPDFDAETRMNGFDKDVYEEVQDAKAEAEAMHVRAQLDIANAAVLMDRQRDEAASFDDRQAQIDAKVEETNRYITETIPKLRAKAKTDGRDEGEAEGYSEGYSRGYESGRSEGLAEGRRAAEAEVAGLRQNATDDAAEASLNREQAEEARRAARASAEALKAHVDRLETVPADVDAWLDSKANKTGTTFRDIYDRTAAQRRQRSAELRRIVDQHTGNERGTDDYQLG